VEGSHYKKIQRDFLISDQIFNANEAKLVNSQKVLVFTTNCVTVLPACPASQTDLPTCGVFGNWKSLR
jgi:hypothetical protein